MTAPAQRPEATVWLELEAWLRRTKPAPPPRPLAGAELDRWRELLAGLEPDEPEPPVRVGQGRWWRRTARRAGRAMTEPASWSWWLWPWWYSPWPWPATQQATAKQPAAKQNPAKQNSTKLDLARRIPPQRPPAR